MTAHILVVGGAGFIGSHMVKRLHRAGYIPIVLDNLSHGHRDAVTAGRLLVGELGDAGVLDIIFQSFPIAAVMHFASSTQVEESVEQPARHYDNNISNTVTLLEAMVKHKVQRFIFSSTAAIFGDPDYVPIDELHPRAPINPYGRSKWMVEEILSDFDKAYGLKACCLRYFNAAGADPEGQLGARHAPETHLIPLLLQVAGGRRQNITVFGTNFDTPDGTCIRDYVHVQDLCDAHLLALEGLLRGGNSDHFNLGNGTGHSILEVIQAVRTVTGHAIPVVRGPRRPGDPPRLIADSTRAREILGWRPSLHELDAMVLHAWRWERTLNERRPAIDKEDGSMTTTSNTTDERRGQQERRSQARGLRDVSSLIIQSRRTTGEFN